MDHAFVDREQPRLLQELSDFLSIPSVSTLPAHEADTRRAAEWLRTELTRLGCPVVDLIEGAGHPVVWAEGPAVPGRPTLLIYGHYDVQPPDPLEEWESPPFAPTVRDGKLYARGAADDKGQVFCLLKAYEAVLGEDGRPPLNVHFIFEGEEECGGRVIFDLLRAELGSVVPISVGHLDLNGNRRLHLFPEVALGGETDSGAKQDGTQVVGASGWCGESSVLGGAYWGIYDADAV